MEFLNYISVWYRSLLITSILTLIVSTYLLTRNNVLSRMLGSLLLFISIISIILSILGIYSIWPFGCDSTWPKLIPYLGGKSFPWKKGLIFQQCNNDSDCCQSYNIPMSCQGAKPESGVPKICSPVKWNCKTSEGSGYKNCRSGYTKITDKNCIDNKCKFIQAGSFGEIASEVAPVIGGVGGGALGFYYGGLTGAAVGSVGGDLTASELASLIPGAGAGPDDKQYWGAGTNFKKIDISVSGTYNTIEDCKDQCVTSVESYKDSDFTKCQDVIKKYCKGNDIKDVDSCKKCINKYQAKIETCQPSGKKPDYAAAARGESGCPKGDIWCGSGGALDVDASKCESIVNPESDEEIQSSLDCPKKLDENNICNTNNVLIGNPIDCKNCINQNKEKIEALGCPKNISDNDISELCYQMSLNFKY